MRDILQKVSNYAIDKVINLFHTYLPPSEKKPRISETCYCSNSSSSGSGFPYIHFTKEYSETKRSFTLGHFHPHQRLTEWDHAINFDPEISLVQQPRLGRGKCRPAEDTRRVLSSFEVVDSQEDTAIARITRQQYLGTHQDAEAHQDGVTQLLQRGLGRGRCGRDGRGRGGRPQAVSWNARGDDQVVELD